MAYACACVYTYICLKQATNILSCLHTAAGDRLHYCCDESVSTPLAILCPGIHPHSAVFICIYRKR